MAKQPARVCPWAPGQSDMSKASHVPGEGEADRDRAHPPQARTAPCAPYDTAQPATIATTGQNGALGEGGNLTETWVSAFSLPGYSVFASAVQLGRARNAWPAAALGLVGAVALLIRPNNGPGILIAALAMVAWSRRPWRALFAVALGAAALCIPVFVYLAACGSLHDMWDQYVEFNRTYGSAALRARLDALRWLAETLVLTPLPFAVARLHVFRPAWGG